MSQQIFTLMTFLLLSSTSMSTSFGAKDDGDQWKRATKTSGANSQDSLQICRAKPDHYWNLQFESCLPCTRCHSLGLLTLRGCAPNKDVVCGTMQDFQKQMEQQIERRGRSEEKRSSWQPYRVALSDEAGTRNEPGSDLLNEEDTEEDEAVYGKPIKYTYANSKNKDNKWSNRRAGGATQKIRQSVKNSSQRKREFLRQIQEEENITRNSGSQNYEEKTASSYDELEGQVKFSEDENSEEKTWVRTGDLHEDLRIIESELLNGGFERGASSTKKQPKSTSTTEPTTSTTTTTTTTTTTATTTTTTQKLVPTYAWPPTPRSDIIVSSIKIKPLRTTTATTSTSTHTITTTTTTATTSTTTRSTTLPLWLRNDYNLEDEEPSDLPDDNEEEMSTHDRKRFMPSTSFDNFGTESDDKDDEVFGAVVKNPTYDEVEADRNPDEFGLLSRLLYRNSEDGKSSHDKDKSSTTAKDDQSLHLTHALIVIGFLIGFSLVFGVGLLYTKVIRIRRFKLLDNRASNASSLGETSLLASRTSSFQRGTDTRLTTSPLVNPPQSPQLGSRTVVATALEIDPPMVISEPSLSVSTNVSPPGSGASTPGYSNGHIPSYVDRRGRTVLKPVRELPV